MRCYKPLLSEIKVRGIVQFTFTFNININNIYFSESLSIFCCCQISTSQLPFQLVSKLKTMETRMRKFIVIYADLSVYKVELQKIQVRTEYNSVISFRTTYRKFFLSQLLNILKQKNKENFQPVPGIWNSNKPL